MSSKEIVKLLRRGMFSDTLLQMAADKIEELENKLVKYADHSLPKGVIVPPCDVGDEVFPLNADLRFRAFISKIEKTTEGLCFEWVQYDVGVDCTELWDAEMFDTEDIGKTVFLSYTEREKALLKKGKTNETDL